MFEEPPAEAPSRVPVAVAADILGVSGQEVAQISVVHGRIRRSLRKINHLAVRNCWMYELEDVLAEKLRRGGRQRFHHDTTGSFITARHAADILSCSVNCIYGYRDGGKIRTEFNKRFLFPRERIAEGYFLPDVLAIRRDQHALSPITHYEEDAIHYWGTTTVTKKRRQQPISNKEQELIQRCLEIYARE